MSCRLDLACEISTPQRKDGFPSYYLPLYPPDTGAVFAPFIVSFLVESSPA